MNLTKIILLLIIGSLLSCIGGRRNGIQNQVQNDVSENEIILLDSIVFESPIININIEKDFRLFVLDGSQEKIFTLSLLNKSIIDTIILPQRINFVKGLASDNIYLYLYTDNSLYRYDSQNKQLALLINQTERVKINDITVNPQGDVFISDGANNQILLLSYLGKVEIFNMPLSDIFTPSNIVYDSDKSELYVLNKAQNRIESYSRIGNLISIVDLPGNFYVRMYKSGNWIFLLENNLKNIDMVNELNYFSFIKNTHYLIKNFILQNNHLFVVDNNKAIYHYLIK